MNPSSEREAFEAWDSAQYEIDAQVYAHKRNDRYVDRPVQGRWEAWQARAALSTQPLQAGWLPIDTAPKGSGPDGPSMTTHPDYIEPPKILLATAEGIVVGYYDWYYHEGYGRGAEPGVSAWRDHDGAQTYGATHWMPLPPVPGQEGVA